MLVEPKSIDGTISLTIHGFNLVLSLLNPPRFKLSMGNLRLQKENVCIQLVAVWQYRQ